MAELLHYKIYSSNSSAKSTPPLILLHGLLGSMDNWRSQARRFSKSRMVITVDLRNHGHSPHLKGMSYKNMAMDIVAILNYENLTKVDLLGHSMGGKVAMWLALNFPDLVSRLIVVDIAPKTYPLWHQKVFSAMMMLPLDTLKSRKEIDQYFAKLIEDDTERVFLSKNLQRKKEGGFKWRCNLSEIAKGYLKIAAFPLSNATFIKKACFVRGERSHYIEAADHFLIQSIFVQSKICSIPEASHLPHIEQADNFYQKIMGFLED